MPKYFALSMGEGGEYVAHGRKGNYIAVGWQKLGDLTWLTDPRPAWEKVWQRLVSEIAKEYGGSATSVGLNAGQVWRFVRELERDDIVLLRNAPERTVIFGEVTGAYRFEAKPTDGCPYPHRRSVQWTKTISRDKLSTKLKNSMGSLLTIFSVDTHAAEITSALGERYLSGEKLATGMIEKLKKMDPKKFEDFAKHLLELAGFQAATTPYVGDKGVDVVGTLSPEGLANITLKVQVKRVGSSLGIDEVLKMRGTLEPAEHGAILTTSKFTKQARVEAEQPGKKSIALIDGEQLVDLILNYYGQLSPEYKELLGIEEKPIPLRDRYILRLEK